MKASERDNLQESNVIIGSSCGRLGTCGECTETGELNPSVRLRTVVLNSTSCGDRRPRVVQVRDALGHDLRIPVSVLQQLSDPAIAKPGTLSVVADRNKVLEICKEGESTIYGLAIDVGTTTLAVYLFDLQTGRRLCVAKRAGD